jgi:uncharacterized membrane protein
MLVHFPIAFWVAANLCDAAALLGVEGAWRLAWLALIAGVGASLLTATAGLLELTRVEESATAAVTRHAMLMVSALAAYAAALLLRTEHWQPVSEPSLLPVALGAAGFLLLVLGGHQGAGLVYRLGVGRADARG